MLLAVDAGGINCQHTTAASAAGRCGNGARPGCTVTNAIQRGRE